MPVSRTCSRSALPSRSRLQAYFTPYIGELQGISTAGCRESTHEPVHRSRITEVASSAHLREAAISAFARAMGDTPAHTSSTAAPTLKLSGESSIFPASILERSRTSFMSLSRRLPLASTSVKNSFCCAIQRPGFLVNCRLREPDDSVQRRAQLGVDMVAKELALEPAGILQCSARSRRRSVASRMAAETNNPSSVSRGLKPDFQGEFSATTALSIATQGRRPSHGGWGWLK